MHRAVGVGGREPAAGHASINLGLAVPLGVAVDLNYAVMDFREAQDELEWAHPDLSGPVHDMVTRQLTRPTAVPPSSRSRAR